MLTRVQVGSGTCCAVGQVVVAGDGGHLWNVGCRRGGRTLGSVILVVVAGGGVRSVGRRLVGAGRGTTVRPRRTSGGGLGGQLTLGGEALQVGHEAQTERVLHVHALDRDQIAGHLGHALPEADDVVIHGETLRVIAGIVKA